MSNPEENCEFIYENLEDEDIFYSANSSTEKYKNSSSRIEYASLVAENEQLKETVEKLLKENERLKCRISELYKTAKTEIERKDERLKQLKEIEKKYEKIQLFNRRKRETFEKTHFSQENYKNNYINDKNSTDKSEVNIKETDSTKLQSYKTYHDKNHSSKEDTKKSTGRHPNYSHSETKHKYSSTETNRSRKRHNDSNDDREKDNKRYKKKSNDQHQIHKEEEIKRQCINPYSNDATGFGVRNKMNYDEYQNRYNEENHSKRSEEKCRSKESDKHRAKLYDKKADNENKLEKNNCTKSSNQKPEKISLKNTTHKIDLREKLKQKGNEKNSKNSESKNKEEPVVKISEKLPENNKTKNSFNENVIIICSSGESDIDSQKRLMEQTKQIPSEIQSLQNSKNLNITHPNLNHETNEKLDQNLKQQSTDSLVENVQIEIPVLEDPVNHKPPPETINLESNHRNEKITILSVIRLKDNVILPPYDLLNPNSDTIITDLDNPVPLSKEEIANISGFSLLNDAQETLNEEQIQTLLDKEVPQNTETVEAVFPNTVFEADQTETEDCSEFNKNELTNAVLSFSPADKEFMNNLQIKPVESAKEKIRKSSKSIKETTILKIKDDDEKSPSWKIKLSEKTKRRNKTSNIHKSLKKFKSSDEINQENHLENKNKPTAKEKDRGKSSQKKRVKFAIPDATENADRAGSLDENISSSVDTENDKKSEILKEIDDTCKSTNSRSLRSKRGNIYSQFKTEINRGKRKRKTDTNEMDKLEPVAKTTAVKSRRKTNERKPSQDSSIPKTTEINDIHSLQKELRSGKKLPNSQAVVVNDPFYQIIDPVTLSEKSSETNSNQCHLSKNNEITITNAHVKEKTVEIKEDQNRNNSTDSLDFSNFLDKAKTSSLSVGSNTNETIVPKISKSNSTSNDASLKSVINTSFENPADRQKVLAKLTQCNPNQLRTDIEIGIPLKRDRKRKPVIMFIN